MNVNKADVNKEDSAKIRNNFRGMFVACDI